MGGFAIAQAQLAALFMQSVAFGIHGVTFAACMYTWFCRSTSTASKARGSMRWMAIAIAFFVIGACDVSFNFYHNLLAFIEYKGPGGADTEFSDASSWVNVIRSVWLYIGATLSDVVMIYRCWIVYSRNKRQLLVTLPALVLWLASVAFSVAILYYLATTHAAKTIPEIPQLQPFIYAFYITSLVLNLFTTCCIIIRLWSVHKVTKAVFSPSSRVHTGRRQITFAEVTLIIVESAILYTATVVLSVVFEVAKSNAYYGVADVSLEVAGISFDLIIIRIWQGTSAEQTQAFVQSASHPLSKHEDTPDVRIASVHQSHRSSDTDALELQVVLARGDAVGWRTKDADAASRELRDEDLV